MAEEAYVGLVAKIRGKLVSPANIDFKKMLYDEGIPREEVLEAFRCIKLESLKLFEVKKVPFKKVEELRKKFLSLWNDDNFRFAHDSFSKGLLESSLLSWISTCFNCGQLRLTASFVEGGAFKKYMKEAYCLKKISLSKTLESAREIYQHYQTDFSQKGHLAIVALSFFYKNSSRHPKMPKFLPSLDRSEKLGLLVLPGHYVGFF